MNVVFWNMENFFDYKDGGGGESDNEFSSFGVRRWTKKKFHAKCCSVAKAIYWLADRYGCIPDVIGMAEIENSNVLFRLLKDTALKKTDYAFVHFDSRDRRGIDVALLYRKSVMSPESVTRKPLVTEEGDSLDTRDILHVRMELKSTVSDIDFIVNHHPSKFGGAKESEGRRKVAMNTLKVLCDSLVDSRPDVRIIAMGDFNDTPDSEPFELIDGTLVNKAFPLYEKCLGTIRYEGKWELIDMFLVSPEMDACTGMEVCRIPFLMTWEKKHPGEKPFRTYSGPRYIGGVSDHCPVVLRY